MAIRTGLVSFLAALVAASAATAPTPVLAAPVDTTPPSVPGTPVATQVTETSALLTWHPSTDDTGVTGYDIWYQRPNDSGFYNNTPVPSYRFTGLTPNTTYTWLVRASDGRNQSGFSAPVTFRTDPAPQDSEPPSPPGAPVASNVTATTATLSWAPSTDNASQPSYQLHAGVEGTASTPVIGGLPGPSTQVNLLIPDLRYDFHLVARDLSGNVSTPSARTRVRTAPDPVAACRATRPTAGNPVALRVTNTGPRALSGWSIRFALPADQQIRYASHAWAQQGRDVVLWWSGWSDEFSVGETLALELVLTSGSPAGPPTGVALNGVPCAEAS